MRTGVLFVGHEGANASAVSSALSHFVDGDKPERYGLSSAPWLNQSLLPNASEILVAGWDIRGKLQDKLVLGKSARGILAGTDTQVGDETVGVATMLVGDAVDTLVHQIEDFRAGQSLANVTVVNCATPPRRVDESVLTLSEERVLAIPLGETVSSVCYALAAIKTGCAYVDFTPSQTLEFDSILRLAMETGTSLAGRDGATGQTFLKTLIVSALAQRGLHARMWYSTNILGNRDGQGLVVPGAGETKMLDKSWGVGEIANLGADAHQIDIRYVPYLEDIKEAWDSAIFEGFVGNQIELKINWRGQDSPIAAQMILDLVRVIAGSRDSCAPGLRRDLSFFFKRPIGVPAASPSAYLRHFVMGNESLLTRPTDDVLQWI